MCGVTANTFGSCTALCINKTKFWQSSQLSMGLKPFMVFLCGGQSFANRLTTSTVYDL